MQLIKRRYAKIKPLFYKKRIRYKYFLSRPYSICIRLRPETAIITPHIVLNTDGQLTINKYYAWDGPSGPTFDTSSFMIGSLVHDALYQLMREGFLPQSCRLDADMILRDLCLKSGMCRLRACWVFCAVRMFGASSARPDERIAP